MLLGQQGSEGGRSGQLKRRRLSVATVDQAADEEEEEEVATEQPPAGAAARAGSAGEARPFPGCCTEIQLAECLLCRRRAVLH